MTQVQIATITKKELLEQMKRNAPIQIVNVLSPEFYALGFIKGSQRIPVDELERRANELDRNKEVITYCAHSECQASRKGAEKLAELGFHARAYEGGIKEWKAAGLPTEP